MSDLYDITSFYRSVLVHWFSINDNPDSQLCVSHACVIDVMRDSIQFNLFNQIIKIIYISIHTWVLVYNVKYNEWFGTPGKHNTANPAQVESAGTKETAPTQRKPRLTRSQNNKTQREEDPNTDPGSRQPLDPREFDSCKADCSL